LQLSINALSGKDLPEELVTEVADCFLSQPRKEIKCGHAHVRQFVKAVSLKFRNFRVIRDEEHLQSIGYECLRNALMNIIRIDISQPRSPDSSLASTQSNFESLERFIIYKNYKLQIIVTIIEKFSSSPTSSSSTSPSLPARTLQLSISNIKGQHLPNELVNELLSILFPTLKDQFIDLSKEKITHPLTHAKQLAIRFNDATFRILTEYLEHESRRALLRGSGSGSLSPHSSSSTPSDSSTSS